jgi:hypothetical protein
MFFSVVNAPLLNGSLTSDIMLIVPEYLILKKMLEQTLNAGEKIIDPPCFVEFAADFKDIGTMKSNPSANIELIKMKVDLLKNKIKTPLQGMDDFSGILGQEIDSDTNKMFKELDNMMMNTKESQDPSSPLYQFIRERNQNIKDNSVSNSDLGLNSYGSFGNFQTNDEKTLEKYRLYAYNHPNSEIAHILNKIDAEKTQKKKEYKNTIYLNPFDKLASHSPKISMPNYNLEYFMERLENLISSICEMPVDSSINIHTNAKALIYKEKSERFKQFIVQKSIWYQDFVRQLWIMAYTPFVKNTKRVLKEKKIELIDSNILELFDKVFITFPKYPQFLDRNNFVDFYKMGIISTEKFYDYMCEIYDLEKEPLSKQRMDRIEELVINSNLVEAEYNKSQSNVSKRKKNVSEDESISEKIYTKSYKVTNENQNKKKKKEEDPEDSTYKRKKRKTEKQDQNDE